MANVPRQRFGEGVVPKVVHDDVLRIQVAHRVKGHAGTDALIFRITDSDFEVHGLLQLCCGQRWEVHFFSCFAEKGGQGFCCGAAPLLGDQILCGPPFVEALF